MEAPSEAPDDHLVSSILIMNHDYAVCGSRILQSSTERSIKCSKLRRTLKSNGSLICRAVLKNLIHSTRTKNLVTVASFTVDDL